MQKIDMIKIFRIILCLLLFVLCCSKEKIYRTVVYFDGVKFNGANIYPENPFRTYKRVDPIMRIPFKDKVEVINNKSGGYVKIKYKDTIGYV
ncbi:MAG: hypothetical protein FWG92_03125, partial [Leptospirales bacterium]|nr:hypothetical protein [Leptospirales bacterium]